MTFSSFFLFLFLFVFSTFSVPPLTFATTFVAPISKDHTTLLYTLSLYLKTPPKLAKLHLDLGSSFTWFDCDRTYISSTYQHIPCGTPFCISVNFNLMCANCYEPPGPACANDTCGLFPENPVTRQADANIAIIDALALPTSDGSTQGQLATFPNYVFSCSRGSLRKGLAKKTSGLAALGRGNYSLPKQISNGFSVPNCFALCLPGSTSDTGVAFFGSRGPYYFSPQKIDLSKSLIYTPMILNPVGTTLITYRDKPSDEYYVGLTSIKVNGKPIQVNTTLLTIDQDGFGGTRISTSAPYTVLQSSIYKAFADAFVKESSVVFNLTVTNAVKPFTVCYSAEKISGTRVGAAVPTVDLVMQGDNAVWRIFGANSMVRVAKNGKDLWCLGFVNGGDRPRAAVVIGGRQLEDNLLQFDLESKRVGFSSSVLLEGTTCANFYFTKTK